VAETIFRLYQKPECDSNLVPLDWYRCRTCKGTGRNPIDDAHCWPCGGYGSLRAAALHALMTPVLHASFTDKVKIRCEGCGHPMSDGTWEGGGAWMRDPGYLGMKLRQAEEALRLCLEPTGNGVLWSPCDEVCRHRGPGRYLRTEGGSWVPVTDTSMVDGQQALLGLPLEASWRQVAVRTLGWPMDLSLNNLKILCTRCYADV
jgi:ribosomal protein L40E